MQTLPIARVSYCETTFRYSTYCITERVDRRTDPSPDVSTYAILGLSYIRWQAYTEWSNSQARQISGKDLSGLNLRKFPFAAALSVQLCGQFHHCFSEPRKQANYDLFVILNCHKQTTQTPDFLLRCHRKAWMLKSVKEPPTLSKVSRGWRAEGVADTNIL